MEIKERIKAMNDTQLNILMRALDSPLSSPDTGTGAAFRLIADIEMVAINEMRSRKIVAHVKKHAGTDLDGDLIGRLRKALS